MPVSKDKSKIPKPKSFTTGTPTNSPVEKPRASGIPTPKSAGGSYRAKYSGLAKQGRLSGVSTKSEPDNRNIKSPYQDLGVNEAPKGVRGRGTKIPGVKPIEHVGIAKWTDNENAPPIIHCHAGGMKNPHIVHKVHSKEKIAQNVCPSHRVYSKEKIPQKEFQSQFEDETAAVIPPGQEEKASKSKSSEYQPGLSVKFNLANLDADVKPTPKEVRGRGSKIPSIKPLEHVGIAKMTDHDNIPSTTPCLRGEMNVDSKDNIAQKESQSQVENKTEPVVSPVQEEKPWKTNSSEIQPELSAKYNFTMTEGEFREGPEVTASISEDYNLEEDVYIAYSDKNTTGAGINIVRMSEFKRNTDAKIAYIVVGEDYEPIVNRSQDDESNNAKQYAGRMTDLTMEDDANDIYEKTPQKAEKESEPNFNADDDSLGNTETEYQMNVKQARISDVLGELENPKHNPIWEEQDFYSDDQERIDDVEQPAEMDNVISDPKLDIQPNVRKNDNISVVENLEFVPMSKRETSLAVNESLEEEIAATFEEIEIKSENQDQDEILSEKLCEENKNNNPVPGQKPTLEVVLREGNRTLDEIDSTLLKWGYFWTVILMLAGIGLLLLYLSNRLKWLDELCRQYFLEPEPPWYQSFYNWVCSFF